MKPIPRNQLKVGMIVQGGDNAGECWRVDEEIVPMKIIGTTKHGGILREGLTGEFPDDNKWGCDCTDLDNLYLVEEPRGEITWENLKSGDIIQSSDGIKVKILAVLDDVFLMSSRASYEQAGSWYSKKEASGYNFSIIQPTKSIREVTQAEVNEKFGEEVRIKG